MFKVIKGVKVPESLSKSDNRRYTILYLVTEDWYFCMHRLPLARAMINSGWRVVVAARAKNHADEIRNEGIELVPLNWRRRGFNPLIGAIEIFRITRLYKDVRPDLVHHVAMKPSIYGSVAAWISGSVGVVNNLAGLGFAFSYSNLPARIMRIVLLFAFHVLFRRSGSKVIVENRDDRDLLVSQAHLDKDKVVLIRGVGVNLERFHMMDELPGILVVTMVSRLLWSKGVREFFEAAQILKEKKVAVRFMLVGTPDADNPDSVPEETLRDWNEQGFLEWAGHREDIPEVWNSSHIAVLPSFYREGIPRSLLEAAACGKPIITTDMPGCREAVISGKNGMLVPPRNSVALANAIEKLASDPVTRRSMGRASREIAEKEFSEARVVGETTGIYREIILASQGISD